ncbi:hypothetical protein [Paraburkholderia terrae]|uniref:Superinfection exclusion protein B n=1 Tax=Paraburkholderia terrae TaxID=311230 RepID=A0ABM7U1V7_9BURK|nr:hypothetical protein [Paraburkholderia terrae]BCZ85299.1 hypothetical protein PTKU64_89740 [Paraburkholderia terrae]BDC45601.1 hypothetical protein PTKU15_88980 [Paraburkholderia terrae]
MKDYDFKSIIETISSASPSHLALVSFLVIPVVMNYWIETINKTVPGISYGWRIIALVVLILVYLACLLWLAMENQRARQLKRKRDQIIAKMVANDWKRISFESAKAAITSPTTDEEIIAVIESFPEALRFVNLIKKDRNGQALREDGRKVYKSGIGLVVPTDRT